MSHWKVLETKELFTSGLFKLTSERCELPDGRIMPRYFVMHFTDWVNILPVTKEGQVVLVEQYRQASQSMHLELPGGAIDSRDASGPAEAARREMLEETGYDAKEVISVASHYPNPALQRNQMHTFVAFDCEKVQDQDLDEFEDLKVRLCSIEQLEQHLYQGDIDHSIMMASILRAMPILKQRFSK